mmetsp:Transcript_55605/g.130265  ORF Transcript_55605/g.130265 Transcript_55605/m.130265 type:complete len:212 (+) Transcript_55605:43-678(+)
MNSVGWHSRWCLIRHPRTIAWRSVVHAGFARRSPEGELRQRPVVVVLRPEGRGKRIRARSGHVLVGCQPPQLRGPEAEHGPFAQRERGAGPCGLRQLVLPRPRHHGRPRAARALRLRAEGEGRRPFVLPRVPVVLPWAGRHAQLVVFRRQIPHPRVAQPTPKPRRARLVQFLHRAPVQPLRHRPVSWEASRCAEPKRWSGLVGGWLIWPHH